MGAADEPPEARAHIDRAAALWRQDREAAQAHLREALAIDPGNVQATVALAQGLTTLGLLDGERLEEARALIEGVLDRLPASARTLAASVLWRSGDYEAAGRLGGLAELGRFSATHGKPTELLQLLARVETDADRLVLLRLHRLWAEGVERAAASRPLNRPERRVRREAPYRVGLLSSDLRHHVVAYFVQPLFQHPDPRVELYGYSFFQGEADYVEQWIAGRVAGFRRLPADERQAAEVIAADDLDLLIELGGPTQANRPGTLAYKPAATHASWLGYPHSLGLAAIDYFLLDPQLTPVRRELLAETPLEMPASWICMSPAAFQAEPSVDPIAPAERTGRITFGTANDPYKFNPRLLRTWARVVAATPGSRFMIVRPEASSPSFRRNIARRFGAEGVSEDRLEFRPVRGAVRQAYADIDVALDTFPLTGGTTTCEALWMGVPTVSLVGEAVYERLSWSILANAGLTDLAATTVDDYVRIAVELAQAPARLTDFRGAIRERIRARPLGQPARFAKDFYDLIVGTLAGRTGA